MWSAAGSVRSVAYGVLATLQHRSARNPLARAITLIASLLALAACGPDVPEPVPNGVAEDPVVRDSAGVRIVRSSAPLWGPGEGWRVEGEPLLRIGAVEGEDPYLFSSAWDVDATRLSDGRIVVLDGRLLEFRAFSPEGAHLWTSGGRGEGPGELSQPRAIQRLEGDVLQVEDRLSRIRYDAEGELVEHVTIDWERVVALGDYTLSGRVVPRFQGSSILLGAASSCLTETGEPCAADASPGRRRMTRTLVRMPWSLERADTIGRFLTSEQWALPAPGGGSGLEMMPLPLAPRGVFATGGTPTRLAFASTDAYRVEIHDLEEGRPILRVERPGLRRPPTPEDLDAGWRRWDGVAESVTAVHERLGRDAGSVADDLRRARSSIPLPDSISEIDELLLDERSHLWVGHRAHADDPLRRWAVFDPDGYFLGEVQVATGVRVLEIGDEYLLGVEADEFGVPEIVLLRLDRGEERREPGAR